MLIYAAINLALTWDSTFWHDEWWYICGRSLGDVDSWLRPHNEHFVTVHVIVYTFLVDVFGLTSHLPFKLALIGTHVAVAAAIFVLVDRHATRVAAAGAAVVMLSSDRVR